MTAITSMSAALQTPPSASDNQASAAAIGALSPTRGVKEALDALSPEALDAAAATLNQAFHEIGIAFEIDDESGRVITRVMDRESGEQIRQIPSEELMRILNYLESQRQEPQSGLLIDDVA